MKNAGGWVARHLRHRSAGIPAGRSAGIPAGRSAGIPAGFRSGQDARDPAARMAALHSPAPRLDDAYASSANFITRRPYSMKTFVASSASSTSLPVCTAAFMCGSMLM